MLKTKPKITSQDYLDTLRALVNNGGDPMMVNDHGDTALHLSTGPIELFQYLLRQEECIVETSQLNYGGDTIAERHARWYWPQGPERARLAWEHENAQRREFYDYRLRGPPPFPITSKILLLHEAAGHLRHLIERDHRDFRSALELIRKLVVDGVNVHAISNEDSESNKTPLAQIPRIDEEIEVSEESRRKESAMANRAINAWLKILKEAGVDEEQYISNEEELVRSSDSGSQWQLYDFDDKYEYRVDWNFRTNVDGSPCKILVEYVFRPVPEEQGEIEEVQDVEVRRKDVPGAWIE